MMLLALFICANAKAGVQLPANMSKGDRESALRMLGFGAGPKLLSDPYPLGGYSGFEIGASIESVPTQDLASMGDKLGSPQKDATLTKITAGKGLYEDVDIFFSFTPYQTQKAEFTEFGGMARWCFYQGARLPFTLSAVGQLSGVNVRDQLSAQTLAVDIVAGADVNDVAIFIGAGPARAQGSFIGGTDGVTDGDHSSQTESVFGWHAMAGASVRFKGAFAAVQIDRWSQTVLSAKVGVRF